MKTSLLLAALLVTAPLLAQPKILTSTEFREGGYDYGDLLAEYSGEWPEGAALTTRKKQNALFETLLSGERTTYSLTIDAFINGKGHLDLLTFHLAAEPLKKEKMIRRLKERLPDLLENWTLDPTGQKIHLHSTTAWQTSIPYRTERKGDSVLNTVEAARAELDTLRIRGLYFHQLKLTEVPYEVIYRFPNLEILDLNSNNIGRIHLDLAHLPRLKQLDLHQNQLHNDSIFLTRNRSLQILNLHSNRLTDLPDAARACKGLRSLWMGGNPRLQPTNRSFRKLRSVTDLNLYKCQLTTLPRGLRRMRRLEVLDLYYNTFAELPGSVTKLRRLTQLAVAHNELTALPARMDRLKKLQVVYAHHNRLSTLPGQMTRLSTLRLLDIGYNWYSKLPEEVLKMNSLRELDLSGNNLRDFPTPLLDMPQLEKLHVRGNPFLLQSEQAYLPYIQRLENNPTQVYY
jgi:Leucine-rich repeat (LRR) protein